MTPRDALRRPLTGRRLLPAVMGAVAVAVAVGWSPASVAASGVTQAAAVASAAAAANVGTPRCGQSQAGHASCFLRMHVARDGVGRVRPAATTTAPAAGYTPSQLEAAYALPVSSGGGQVIAVVDAYDTPAAESDLAAYRSQFGMPACSTANGCFRKVDLAGNASAVPYGWDIETALDLDMASAGCPNCGIVLVEARSDSFNDIYPAIQSAIDSGATEVSMSFGMPETPDEQNHDYLFNRPGVAFTASTGDCGFGVSYPAASPYVAAVGGTTLLTAGNLRGWSETAWVGAPADPADCGSAAVGAGSGCSQFEPKPSWQTDAGCPGAPSPTSPRSATSAPGWPSTTAPPGAGCRSEAPAPPRPSSPAPGRSSGGLGYYPPGAEAFYQSTGGNVDVTQDTHPAGVSCGPSYLCNAATGYDGPTGVGSPVGGLIDVGVGVSQQYVQHLYTDLIGSQDPNGENYWVSQLLRGLPRYSVAYTFTQTMAYDTAVVSQLYQNVMGRAPDGAGADYWAGKMRGGMTPEAIAAFMVASPERFASPSFGNNNNDTFIVATYRALLGRDPDAAGRAFWNSLLAGGGSRGQLTLGFVHSPEWAGVTVRNMYARYHLSTDDSAGVAYWTQQVLGGMPDDQLAADLIASQQYYNWAQAN